MNLYLISQSEKNGYDTYDSAVVAAETTEEARLIRAGGDKWPSEGDQNWDWAETPDQVTVKLLGQAVADTPAGVVLASYNAG